MPIRPENRNLYPKNWEWIRVCVLARATDRFGITRCEGSPTYPECRAINWRPHPVTRSRVIITIAHLTHDPRVSDPLLLRAWCQRCHNKYDQAHRRQTRTDDARAPELGLPEPNLWWPVKLFGNAK